MVTAKDFKESMITEGMKRAAEAVFVCMAAVETIRPIVREYQHRILEEEKYEYSEKHLHRRRKSHEDYIKDPERTYLMSDKDFKHYRKRSETEQARAGLVTEHPDECPLLVAENNLRKAQNILMDAMKPLTGLDPMKIYKLEHRKQYIDITLRFLAPYVEG